VIPKFAEIIKKHQDEEKISTNPEYPFKAVGWVKQTDRADKLCIKSYYPAFEEMLHKPKIDYDSLIAYINLSSRINVKDEGLGPVRKNIVNAILKVLRFEDIKHDDKNFTDYKLFEYLNEIDSNLCDKLKINVLRWCRMLNNKDVITAHTEIKDFIINVLNKIWNRSKLHPNTQNFLRQNGAVDLPVAQLNTENVLVNMYKDESTGIQIEINTVHSVKGETHTATLYLETFYYGKYESEWLKDQFNKVSLTNNVNLRAKQASRIVYVGFSRPTHLLCVAIHEDRFANIRNYDNNWEIVR
jgi:hypothetical protein